MNRETMPVTTKPSPSPQSPATCRPPARPFPLKPSLLAMVIALAALWPLAALGQEGVDGTTDHGAGSETCSAGGAECGGTGQAAGAQVCGSSATLISTIQGSGSSSELVREVVTVEAVVVGDFQPADGDPFGSDLAGFYLQEEDSQSDGDPATSEGIFVYSARADDVDSGDLVRVTGRVSESQGLTQLESIEELLRCGKVDLPEATEVLLPFSDEEFAERYEGMLVRLPQSLVISEYFNFDRYGEVVLTVPAEGMDRPFQPTSFLLPAQNALQYRADLALRRITLDDTRSSQNPHPPRHPAGGEFDLDNLFRGGDTLANVEGVFDHRFGLYRVQPTAPAVHRSENPRPQSPPELGGTLTVASFNVLNYFTTLGGRGADDPEEFERQQAKIVAALTAIEADVVALIEIENYPGALANLVAALNEEVGEGVYEYVDTGIMGPDEIAVALIYRPATVTPVGEHAVLAGEFLDPRGSGAPRNRPALAQSFEENATGEVFTAVVNHFKSKGSSCGGDDDDPLQGNCNLTRTLAAGLLLDWIAGDPTGSADPDFLLLGDYNAYDEEDPVRRLLAGYDGQIGTEDDITDLLETHGGEFVYTYVFDGQFGHLDYALATPGLVRQVTGAATWPINSDEPDLLDYDTTFKPRPQHELYRPDPFRSSDHDPIIVGLELGAGKVTGE